MFNLKLTNDPLFLAGRRTFLARSGVVLSGTAVALLAGRESLAAQLKKTGAASVANDMKILNSALGAEHQAHRRLPGRSRKRVAAEARAGLGPAVPGPSQGTRRPARGDREAAWEALQ